ncbi:2-oxoglutarate and iron-dependent oxygenase domain-containing protein [Marinobacter sp. chi1]|uniref:2-oxoglutarate-dependent ethylene/succinate-forming enzyme n=1 Tax=Marinobacter suaedae TaxID=3057675 RepID=A0ABT8VZ05_9GAMM|nr:2-oxoglutarate and iron-dependent oxygenase domain-containing protein [Marinobacter sp. chi1]MDO3721200.1 2-oxoglutarate and iron-dependent oxygenase domain-containing protein [Marinobacter sp. chi1]
MSSLPIISLTGLMSDDLDQRKETAAELGRACREVGFFYVKDHGIPASVSEGAFELARQLFALPQDQKQAMSIKNSPHNRGYVAMADEKLNPESGADMKEGFNIGTDFPADHPDVLAGKPFRGVNFWPEIDGWRERALEYFNACLDMGRVIHRGLSLDLGCPEDFFEPHLKEPIATLRMLRYPASADQIDRQDGGAGTHTDYGNITILATDKVAGLEVSNRQGEWIQAPHVPGAFVCNIGDCLMRWSNDVYVSTPHRVRPPESERYSIPFFLEVGPESVVDPRDIAPDDTPKYEPIAFADYLASRLNATYDHRAD